MPRMGWTERASGRGSLVRSAAAGIAASCTLAGLVIGLAGAASEAAAASGATGRHGPPATDWANYLYGPRHSSFNAAENAITTSNARSLVRRWHKRGDFLASPTVADGAVFIGSNSGWFYKLDESTGKVLHKIFIGKQPQRTCPATGVVSTATVAPAPRTHKETVYVAGPSGYLYALAASNLKPRWRARIAIPSHRISNFFDWSSPTVSKDKIYIGVSSNCDQPLIRGGVIGFRQSSGKRFAHFYTVPRFGIGGSVWSSVAVGPDGDVYASTGNGSARDGTPQLGASESIIKLGGHTLRFLGGFKIPLAQAVSDSDFGASPVLFGPYVGACNKNGIFYAVRRSTMRLAWERRIGGEANGKLERECDAAPVFSGRFLYFGGPDVTIRGHFYGGSVQKRSISGNLIWERGLPASVVGSPSMDRGDVVAVGTFQTEHARTGTYLINGATGRILRMLTHGLDFAQSTFADNWLFTANQFGVNAWALGTHQ
jgi:outer membrane protein assembly factor BamB